MGTHLRVVVLNESKTFENLLNPVILVFIG